jgi:general secretion pathway protein L
MLMGFFAWWLARISELLPISFVRRRKGILIEFSHSDEITSSICHGRRMTPVDLPTAARARGRKTVILRSPPSSVLTKQHSLPAIPTHQIHQMLRHELGRITPFPPEELFWTWTAQRRSGTQGRLFVTITMVPRTTLQPTLGKLEQAGLPPDLLEVQTTERIIRLPPDRASGQTSRPAPTLLAIAATLAIGMLVMPFAIQAVALYRTNTAIAALEPTVARVTLLRHRISGRNGAEDLVAQEIKRTGDLLQAMAEITNILPDDSWLTDLTLHQRQLTLGGHSASAARLIADLSANPAIHGAAFAAPVTRARGTSADIFLIKAEVAK